MNGFVKLFLSVVLAGTACAYPVSQQVEQAPKAVQQEVVPKPPYTLQAKRRNPVDKYAVMVIGSSFKYTEGFSDPVDKNVFWLNSTYEFKYLQELGFNTYIFYADGEPDFSEEINLGTVSYLKKHKFRGPSRWHEASIGNLERLVNKLAKKVDDNDIFVLSISTHGNPSSLIMEDGLDELGPDQLTKMLKKIKPGFGLLFVDACHSGAYIEKLDLDDYTVIAATGRDTYAWGDRGFSSSRYFFRNLGNTESDTNVDGKVTVREAFEKTEQESLAHMKRIENYLLTEYVWGEADDPAELLKELSVIPVMKTGKNVSDSFYLFDSWYFEKD